MKKTAFENFAISFIASFGVLLGSAPYWLVYCTSMSVLKAFCALLAAMFAAVSFARWGLRRIKHKRKVKITYESHNMHSDEQRLGYISAETIREIYHI